MNTTILSPQTVKCIDALFAPEQRAQATAALVERCGNNLPGLGSVSGVELERFRLAALKLSDGNLEKLEQAMQLAQTDWRDLLVGAGFADDIEAHKSWLPAQAKWS